MKQLIALGNGWLCPAAQGSNFEACPTDPALRKHIRAVSRFPVRSAFLAPLLVCSLQTCFISLFHQPSMLNVVCANSQHERCLCQHGLLLGTPGHRSCRHSTVLGWPRTHGSGWLCRQVSVLSLRGVIPTMAPSFPQVFCTCRGSVLP